MSDEAKSVKNEEGGGGVRSLMVRVFKTGRAQAMARMQDGDFTRSMREAQMAVLQGDGSKMQELRKSELKAVADECKEDLEAIWEAYGADKDGNLSDTDTEKMCEVAISAYNKALESTLAAGLKEEIAESLSAIEEGLLVDCPKIPKENLPELKKEAENMVETQIPAASQAATEPLCTKQTYDKFKQLMDENKDGKVSKDEFLAQFYGAMNGIYPVMQIQELVGEAMSSELEKLIARFTIEEEKKGEGNGKEGADESSKRG
mmetsp:Transcript_42603/g.68644  ORF Transcript_42603/g.68644 Transcript_42603/m.68644 type:complete len:261 (+) Transcript_42603:318-1100(+)